MPTNEARPALFRWFPRLDGALPWVPLGRVPTPLESIALELDGRAYEVLVKRDDLGGSPYGGNKVRKLEFILADARARGARRLITAGAAGSHHALATTIYGRRLGFDVTLVLFPQPLTAHVREVLLAGHAYGADLRWTRRMETVPLRLAHARIAHRADRPYMVAPGGSDALGTLGYVSAGLELVEQLKHGRVPRPTAVYVAAGTLGTVAGLAIGLSIAGRALPIRATRITSRLITNERVLRGLIGATADVLRMHGIAVPPVADIAAHVEIGHDHIGAGYGRETPGGVEATTVFARHGLTLDPTYTAKAAAALLADLGGDGGPPLLVHTLSAEAPAPAAAEAAGLPAIVRRYLQV
jgi:D-cysteine desulfhydrase